MACVELSIRHSLGSHAPQPRGLAPRRPRPTPGPVGLGSSQRPRPVRCPAGLAGLGCTDAVALESWRRGGGIPCCRCPRCTSEASGFTRFGSHLSRMGGCALSRLGRRGIWADCGARSGSAPPGSGPWRAFSSQISQWGGTLVFADSAGSRADPRGEIVWGRQREVDK